MGLARVSPGLLGDGRSDAGRGSADERPPRWLTLDRGKRPATALSYLGYDSGVAVGKVSLSIDEDLLAEARARAGRRELSSYVNEALRRQLQRDRLTELLAEMEAKSGPIPDDVMEEARRLWRGPAAKRRRRA